ncbi:MAG: sulfotransferase [Anaerolineales bacterium]|nr:sulfotransferase [Anaerolineales bacterium]
MVSDKKFTYTYITSFKYSGSTLLSMFLNLHPQVSTLGELYWMYPLHREKIGCSCGRVTSECPYWLSIHDAVSEISGEPWSFAAVLRPRYSESRYLNQLYLSVWDRPWMESINDKIVRLLPGYSEWFEELKRHHNAFFTGVFRATNTMCFVDESKTPWMLKYIPRFHQDHHVRIIHLFRDPRGVVASRKRKKESGTLDGWVDEWIKTEVEIELRSKMYYPEKDILLLNYDELCLSPETTWYTLLDFIGLPSYPFFGDLGKVEHHVIGNRSSFLRNGTNIVLDEKWHNELDNKELSRIQRRFEEKSPNWLLARLSPIMTLL